MPVARNCGGSVVPPKSTSGIEIKRPEFYVQTGSMFDNPYGVDPEEIAKIVTENSPEMVAQVVFGKYVELSGLVFTGELIQNAIDRSLPRVLGSAWVDREAAKQAQLDYEITKWWGQRYHTGVDLARQTDYTVIFTIDTMGVPDRPAKLVYYKRINRVPWESIYAEIGLARYLFGPNILFDSTGPGGDTVRDALESRQYCATHHRTLLNDARCQKNGEFLGCSPRDYLALNCADGFHFSGSSKKELVEHLRNVLSIGYNPGNPDVSFGWLRVPPIPQLEEELAFYAWDDKRLQTDCLFALALACWSGLEDVVGDSVIGSIFGQ